MYIRPGEKKRRDRETDREAERETEIDFKFVAGDYSFVFLEKKRKTNCRKKEEYKRSKLDRESEKVKER